MREITKKLIEAVKADLVPSLGVTEPGAIAFAAACAARALGGEPVTVGVWLNSGIYKNSFSCAVPGTDGMGCALAAAMGAVCGIPELGLSALRNASEEDVIKAKLLVGSGAARAYLESISPKISILAEVTTEKGKAEARIAGRHDRLVSLKENGKETLTGAEELLEEAEGFKVSSVKFADIVSAVYEAVKLDKLETAHGEDCIEVDSRPGTEKIDFFDIAVDLDMELFREGKRCGLMPMTEARTGGFEDDCKTARELAEMLTCGAIEARVRGAARPAMAITGSGSHGILCMLPIHAAAVKDGFGKDEERKALLLSALVTKYIKELSGLLSTACGCVLAGGTGAALGLTYLYSTRDGVSPAVLEERLCASPSFMAASLTGMICHGGNPGCSLKAAAGVNMAFSACEMALHGVKAEPAHGIVGITPEETMLNMGLVAEGMLPVEKTIIDIMSCKTEQGLL